MTFAAWSKIEQGGASSSGSFVLDNLDWKATIGVIAEVISAETAAHAAH